MKAKTLGVCGRLGCAVMAILLACVTSADSGGSVEHPTLQQVVDRAARIARVRIVSRERMEFEYEGKPYLCGYLYTAEVASNLKGGTEAFQFVSEVDEDFGGFDKEHFLIAYHRDPGKALEALRPFLESHKGLEREKQLCDLSIEYFVTSSLQMLLPFDSEAARQFGGEWLRQRRLSVVSDDDFDRRELSVGEESYWVIRWQDVNNAIRKALERSPGLSLSQDLVEDLP
jgi:hypothetical protein